MKNIFLFLIIVLSINVSNAQEHKEYYDNGNLKISGQYDSNDSKIGEWKQYYENGSLMMIEVFENGKQMGEVKLFHENGQLMMIGMGENGQPTGEWKFFHTNGQLSSVGKFENGKRTGEWKDYRENGKLKEVGKWVNGKETGKWKIYDEDGNLTTESYLNGEKQEKIDADEAAAKKAARDRKAQEELDNYEALKRSPAYMWAKQKLSIEELEALIEYFGSNDAKVYEFNCFRDRKTKALFIKSKYKKDKVYYQGKYYYNVYYEMQLKFKDVNSVYESGDKIYFNIGSEGFKQKAKPPGEDWSDYVKNFSDFTMTIYDVDKRKEALNYFKYLVEHPYEIEFDR